MDFFAPGLDTVTGSEEGRPLTIMLLDGQPLKRKDGVAVQIWLYGPDSQRYRDNYRAYTRAIAAGRAEKGEGFDEQPALLAFLASMTARWNVQMADGKEAPCTPEAVQSFYAQFPVARDAADLFIGKRSNFTSASSAS